MIDTSLATVDNYIESAEKSVRPALRQLRATIRKAAPDAQEGISYGMPSYKQDGMLVYFAAYKNHIGFYPGASGVAAFEKETGRYHTSKGTIQFPLDKPLPVKLISRIVQFRLKQNIEKMILRKLAKKKLPLKKKAPAAKKTAR